MEMPVTYQGRELPSFTLRQEEVPELITWDIGSSHYLVIKVELVEKHNTKVLGLEDFGDREKLEGRFQVLNVKPLTDKPIDRKTIEREDFERIVAKARSEGE